MDFIEKNDKMLQKKQQPNTPPLKKEETNKKKHGSFERKAIKANLNHTVISEQPDLTCVTVTTNRHSKLVTVEFGSIVW